MYDFFPCLRRIKWILLFLSLSLYLFAGPYLDPVLFAGAVNPQTAAELMRIALRASGVGTEDIPVYEERFAALARDIRTSGVMAAVRPGETLLVELHRRVFRKYSEPQTRIDKVFDTGVYNCVSSAVIYAVIAFDLGLKVEGVLAVDHAFCAVLDGREMIDVETTTVYGFDPGRKKEFTDSFGQTGFSYVPPGNYRLRENISLVRLISLILQNRASEAEKRPDYASAVSLSVERYALSPDKNAHDDMISEFLNYAAFLNERSEYSAALDFLDNARRRYGYRADYMHSISTLVYNSVLVLNEEKESARALSLIRSRFESGDITEEKYREFKGMIGDSRAFRLIADTPDNALASAGIDALRSEGLLDERRYREYKIVLLSREAEELSRAGDNLKALVLVREGFRVFGSHEFFGKAEQIYSHNVAVEYHNRAAGLLNAGDRQGALDIIHAGLEALPGNQILLRDLDIIDSYHR